MAVKAKKFGTSPPRRGNWVAETLSYSIFLFANDRNDSNGETLKVRHGLAKITTRDLPFLCPTTDNDRTKDGAWLACNDARRFARWHAYAYSDTGKTCIERANSTCMYVSSVRTKVRECALLVTSVHACTKDDDRSLCFHFIPYEPTLKNGSFFNPFASKRGSIRALQQSSILPSIDR